MRTDLKCFAIVKALFLLVMLSCVACNIILRGNLSQARMTSAKARLILIQQALEDFKTKTGKYPEKIADVMGAFDTDTITKIKALDLLYSVNMTCDKYTLYSGEFLRIKNKITHKATQRVWIHIGFGVTIISLWFILIRNFKKEAIAQREVTRKFFSDYSVLSALFLLMLLLAVDVFSLIS